MSKLFSVRVPDEELAALKEKFGWFPGASPALIIRALLHSSTRISIGNALNRHHSHKSPAKGESHDSPG